MPLPCKIRHWPSWLLMVSWMVVAAPGIAPRAVAGAESARRTPIVEAVERARPSVVSITSEKRSSSPARWPYSPEESQRPRVSGMGTGVILDERGYILTNQHVIDQVQGIEIQLEDGSHYPGRVVQQDRSMDLALLKIDAGRPLKPIHIGTSADLMVGETVITIGNAFGYENTTSIGIISWLGRNVTLSDDQVYRNLIQTDAGINPGNSGGPLLNIDGELIGINVATRAGAQGIGFALPIDDVKRAAAEMFSTKRLVGTWHGVVAGERLLETGRWVQVAAIDGGSPAEAAGIRPGDRVLRVNNLEIHTSIDIERALLDLRPGQRADVVVNRDGQEQAMAIEVQSLPGSSPGDAAAEQVWKLLGIKTVRVASDYVANASSRLRGGLYVQEVLPGSLAARSFIQKGDILIGMNVGDRHWETIRADNVLYILRQSETQHSSSLQYYIVRRNAIHQGQLNLSEVQAASAFSR
ncbi:trypsin-like peptidase domain-containing protein [soil metagenome]